MPIFLNWLAPVLAVLGVGFAIGLGDNDWAALVYRQDMLAAGGQVAGALFVVAVFLERALSVINDLIFGEETVNGESRLRVASLSPPADRAQLIALAALTLDRLADDKKRVRLGVGFLASVFIAGAGVRTFAGLLDLTGVAGNQLILLNIMDILLTAGLLAGGSNALAEIIEIFSRRIKARKAREMLFGSGPESDEAARLERAGFAPPKATLAPPALAIPSTDTANDYSLVNDIDELDLVEPARSAAVSLQSQFPNVIFTSGRRTIAQQANAMAGNVVKARDWIERTYKASPERDSLQKWVDDNPAITTLAGIAAGLRTIMQSWSEAQLQKFSRHFGGLAFDVQPTGDSRIKDAIRALPGVEFLDSEGGLTIWHAQFKSPQ